MLAAERHAALREAFTHLPPDYQRLTAMLVADPPVPYPEISAGLGMPIGSIGPTRSRCLDKIRRHPAVADQLHVVLAEAGHGCGWLNPRECALGSRPPQRQRTVLVTPGT